MKVLNAYKIMNGVRTDLLTGETQVLHTGTPKGDIIITARMVPTTQHAPVEYVPEQPMVLDIPDFMKRYMEGKKK